MLEDQEAEPLIEDILNHLEDAEDALVFAIGSS
jgi:hypothetical protein